MSDVPKKPYREGCDDAVPQQGDSSSTGPQLVPDEEIAAEEEGHKESGIGPDMDPSPDREPSQEEAPPPEQGPGPEQEIIPETAFVVVRHTDGRVEATTTLPGFKMQRQAGLRDLRDISHALFLDVSTTIQSRVSAVETSKAFQKAAIDRQISQMTQGLKKN